MYIYIVILIYFPRTFHIFGLGTGPSHFSPARQTSTKEKVKYMLSDQSVTFLHQDDCSYFSSEGHLLLMKYRFLSCVACFSQLHTPVTVQSQLKLYRRTIFLCHTDFAWSGALCMRDSCFEGLGVRKRIRVEGWGVRETKGKSVEILGS